MGRSKGNQPSAETSPLRVGAVTGISHVVQQPRTGLLKLRPAMFPLLVGATIAVVFMAIGAAVWRSGQWAGVFPGALGAAFLLLFVLMIVFGQRVEFDRDAGEWKVRRWGLSCCYRSLDCIKAVQLIEGGWHDSNEGAKYFTYQLNLVLDDADQPRLNLTNMSNWDATWAIGSRLAEFLGVELIDSVPRE